MMLRWKRLLPPLVLFCFFTSVHGASISKYQTDVDTHERADDTAVTPATPVDMQDIQGRARRWFIYGLDYGLRSFGFRYPAYNYGYNFYNPYAAYGIYGKRQVDQGDEPEIDDDVFDMPYENEIMKKEEPITSRFRNERSTPDMSPEPTERNAEYLDTNESQERARRWFGLARLGYVNTPRAGVYPFFSYPFFRYGYSGYPLVYLGKRDGKVQQQPMKELVKTNTE